MEILLALVVMAAALAVLAYPLYRARTITELHAASTLHEVMAERDGVYAMLRDLDLDYALGKLSETDYTLLRAKYMTRAADLLRQWDALRGIGVTANASAELEREIAALRRTSSRRAMSALRCPNCGHSYDAGDKFCSQCGQALG